MIVQIEKEYRLNAKSRNTRCHIVMKCLSSYLHARLSNYSKLYKNFQADRLYNTALRFTIITHFYRTSLSLT